jgi:metallo-beta-lactamase family protein
MSHLQTLSDLLDSSKTIAQMSTPKNLGVADVGSPPSSTQLGLPAHHTLPTSPLFYKPFGACGTVTGSAHFVFHSASGKCFAVDCGILQGESDPLANNVESLPIPPKALHALFLTHAHADHVGNLFAWLRAGFRGKIYCTDVTSKLTVISLRDSMNRQEPQDGDEALWDLLPTLFVCPDRKSTASHGRLFPVEGAEGLSYSFTPTSHLIGCAALRLMSMAKGQSHADIIFSGDIGPVTDSAAHGGLAPARLLPTSFSGVVVLEATYGDRDDRDPATLLGEERLKALAAVIKEAVSKGPKAHLIVPAFSLGRTTDLLADIYVVLASMREAAGLTSADVPSINIESQLATQYADVLAEAYGATKGTGEFSWLNKDARLVKLGGLPLLKRLLSASAEPTQVHDTSDGKVAVNWGEAINGTGLTIVIAGSGTSTHGRVCREIMDHATNPQATVLLCGYCPESSLGNQLREIARHPLAERASLPPLSLRIADGKDGKPRFWPELADAVKINLADLSPYYSGHADSRSLMHYALSLGKPLELPMDFILVHGSNKARSQFSRKLKAGLGQGYNFAREVHCPSSNYPWFDVAQKKWCFDDLGALRSSMRVNVRDRMGADAAAYNVAQAISRNLARFLKLNSSQVVDGKHGTRFVITGEFANACVSHEVHVVDLGHDDFDIRVDSLIGCCQSNDDFKARCFPWEAAVGSLDEHVELGYKPVGKEDEVVDLIRSIRDPQRAFPVLLVTKLGEDNTCAKFLSKSLMLESGIVRLVTGQGRIFGRELGLDVHSGVGIFFDEQPGSTPVQFSILHPLDTAPAFLACLNRLEDARRLSAAA